ncbi:hypothetical protein OHA40_29230 [Nocardia sp. NBC_00508]|uniref:hypothetical protein n=1 Tax=Nocardia sp. NBC_00508 TaxID=2975992 RepID=UPI002E80CE80|nr:hypothetical protein [Nocardia sp. NBC_00508]WUD65658.1 hypothetical protein OHA40_29230 [Nocardia sp. NBC_00508]
MFRIALRLVVTAGSAVAVAGTGAGLAAAGPTLSADTQEEGTIAVGSQPASESWTCALLGSGEQAGMRVDVARNGESRGGFAAGSTVTAACAGPQWPMVALTTGVTSLDDAD